MEPRIWCSMPESCKMAIWQHLYSQYPGFGLGAINVVWDVAWNCLNYPSFALLHTAMTTWSCPKKSMKSISQVNSKIGGCHSETYQCRCSRARDGSVQRNVFLCFFWVEGGWWCRVLGIQHQKFHCRTRLEYSSLEFSLICPILFTVLAWQNWYMLASTFQTSFSNKWQKQYVRWTQWIYRSHASRFVR